jgi:hypothetical protein
MPTVSDRAPACHGKCRLEITINGVLHRVLRVRFGRACRHVKSWSLSIPGSDQPSLFVTREHAVLSCTCETSRVHHLQCAHVRALVATGLLCGRQSPSLRARAQGVNHV